MLAFSTDQRCKDRQQAPRWKTAGPVWRRIADGFCNAEIAETLIISEKTVKSHVSNILSKLHLADRTQAAVHAWREGIMRREDAI